MTITTISSREFNQDVSKTKRAADKGPVFITDRGKPKHVLLNIDDYRKLTQSNDSIVDMLAMPDSGDIDFEPETLKKKLIKPEDFD